ncbi:MAG: ArsR family transcriptional regulator [Vicinamibacterales bacterium]
MCHIHASLKVPQPTASRHLAYLRRTGLVAARRDGVWMHYSLAPQADPVTAAVVDAALHALGRTEGHLAGCRAVAARARGAMTTVLFACVHNAGRSQMAAALFNRVADPQKARARSAGTAPGAAVHPEVIAAMQNSTWTCPAPCLSR